MAEPSTNGHALPPDSTPAPAGPPELDSLRQQLEIARTRRELLQEQLHGDMLARQQQRLRATAPDRQQWTPAVVSKLKRLVEQAVADGGGRLQEDWFERWTPFAGTGLDADGWHRLGAMMDTTWARKGGKAWPYLFTEIDLDRYREFSRTLVRENSHAKGLLRNYCNYVVGPGPDLKVNVRDEVPEALRPEAEQMADVGQEYLDGWGKRAKIRTRTRAILWRVKRDGEAILRHYVYRNELVLRWVEPVYVRNKPGGGEEEGWTIGVQHRVYSDGTEDVETILNYHIVHPGKLGQHQAGEQGKWPTPVESERETATGEIVPARRITHVKNLDDDDTVKRGLPEFIGETAGNLIRAADLLRATLEGSTERALIAIVNQWANATRDGVMAFNPDTDGGGSDFCDRHYLRGGKRGPVEVYVPKGHEYKDPPRSTGPATDIEVVQAGLRGSCAPMGAPEYWTGDASNNNYASSKEAGSPIMRAAETEQAYLEDLVKELAEKALRVRIRAGLLPARLLELCEVQAELPKLLVRDRKETIDEEIALVEAGLKDKQSAQMDLGLNPDRIKANLVKERAENPQPVPGVPGQEPPPGQSPGAPPGNGPPRPPVPPQPQPAPPARVQESAEHDVSDETRDESGKWTKDGGKGPNKKWSADKVKKLSPGAAGLDQGILDRAAHDLNNGANVQHVTMALVRAGWGEPYVPVGSEEPSQQEPSRDEGIARLKDARRKSVHFDNVSENPLGHRTRGTPADAPRVERIGQLVREFSAQSGAGMPLDKLYATLRKEEPTLTKKELQDTLLPAHLGRKLRLSGWSGTLDEIPDPNLAMHYGGKEFWYVEPTTPRVQESAAVSTADFANVQESGEPGGEEDHGMLTEEIAAILTSQDRPDEPQKPEPKEEPVAVSEPPAPAPQPPMHLTVNVNLPEGAVQVTTPITLPEAAPQQLQLPDGVAESLARIADKPAAAPVVHVEAPAVTVTPTVTVSAPESPARAIQFTRDADGKITGATSLPPPEGGGAP